MSFAAFVTAGIYRLIRLRLTRDMGIDEELFNRLAKAFMEHKKDMHRRVKHLEAIAANKEEVPEYPELKEPNAGDTGTLNNQLDRKRRVR